MSYMIRGKRFAKQNQAAGSPDLRKLAVKCLDHAAQDPDLRRYASAIYEIGEIPAETPNEKGTDGVAPGAGIFIRFWGRGDGDNSEAGLFDWDFELRYQDRGGNGDVEGLTCMKVYRADNIPDPDRRDDP